MRIGCLLVMVLSTLVGGEIFATEAIKTMPVKMSAIDEFKLLNRLTWGANLSVVDKATKMGISAYISEQLNPPAARLPEIIQKQIDALSISQQTVAQLVEVMEKRRKAAAAITDPDDKKAAFEANQKEQFRLARESSTRFILRALYSPNQVQEQMIWFWLNHFSIFQQKANLRLLVRDYEEIAIRPYALGKFRDLLGAVAHHPAMLQYLDNEQNAIRHINENYARELMELHTLGVNGGYSQQDVQDLARVLTGVGVNFGDVMPKVQVKLQQYYVRQGFFEFNPNRHDFDNKQFLGQPIVSRGLPELDEVLDRLVRHPSTARFISHKLAVFWVEDEPPVALVSRIAETFKRTDGSISACLQTLFSSPEFLQASGRKFKDPMRYLISAVRLTYDEKPILNPAPILNWLNRLGESLNNRQTPDGYPMTASAWASSGQMATRFEVAKSIGFGNAGLFKPADPQATEVPAFPQLANALYYQFISKMLSPATRKALDQATSSQEWNMFLLSSPEMMYR